MPYMWVFCVTGPGRGARPSAVQQMTSSLEYFARTIYSKAARRKQAILSATIFVRRRRRHQSLCETRTAMCVAEFCRR